MAKLKCKGKTLAPRILLASFISIVIDIILFFSIAFLGAIPISVFFNIFAFAVAKKIICEIILLPLIWLLIDLFKKKEGFEINDFDTDFTPFSLDNVYDFNAYKQINSSKSNLKKII